MAQTLVEKPVLFSGIWRPRHSIDDMFFRTVNHQFQDKPGVKAKWVLTTEGLTIVVDQLKSGRPGKSDQIPVQAMREVTVNRYNPLCLMTLFVDPTRRFSALVCRCQSEQDASHIVQVFRQLQKSQSGEGYRIDLKQPQGINWTLKTKQNGQGDTDPKINGHYEHPNDTAVSYIHQHQHHINHPYNNEAGMTSPKDVSYIHHNNNNKGAVIVEMEEEILEREPLEVEGRPCFNVGVQAELAMDDDTISMSSEMSYQSLKDELVTLSNEVRDIKILIEKTTGISAEEFFRRRRDPNSPGLVPVRRVLSKDGDVGLRNSEKHVNFADDEADDGGETEEEEMDFDIRSVGMQTADLGSKRSKYQKRVRHALTPNRYQQSSGRHRSGSSSSSMSSPGPVSPGPMSPMSPYSPGSPQDGSVFSYSSTAQRYVDPRRDPRLGSISRGGSVYSSGSTVLKPIESVYHVHTPGFRQKRRQVIIMPKRSASMPRQVRPVSATGAPPSPIPQSPSFRHPIPQSPSPSLQSPNVHTQHLQSFSPPSPILKNSTSVQGPTTQTMNSAVESAGQNGAS